MEAADLLSNFNQYWQECENVGDVMAARQQLISKIVARVFVYDDRVIGIALHGDFGVILDDAVMAPKDVLDGLNVEITKGVYKSEFAHTQSGSDGICIGHNHLIILTCVYIRHYTVIFNGDKLPVIFVPMRTSICFASCLIALRLTDVNLTLKICSRLSGGFGGVIGLLIAFPLVLQMNRAYHIGR